MGLMRHSRLVITLALCSSVGIAIALTTQLSPTESDEGGGSQRHRLRNRRSPMHEARVHDGWRRAEEDSASDVEEERDGGPSKDAGTLAESAEVERDDGGDFSARQNLLPLLLKGQNAESAWTMYDYYYEREDHDEQDGGDTGRSLARRQKKNTTTKTTMKTTTKKNKATTKKNSNTKKNKNYKNYKNQKNQKNQKKMGSNGKTSGGGNSQVTNVNVDVDVDVNVFAPQQSTGGGGHGGHAPGFNKHEGRPPGFNKQGGSTPGTHVGKKPSSGSSPAPPKVTKKTKKGKNGGMMCPCPSPHGGSGVYVPPGGNGGAMAMYSIELADASDGNDPANPILSGGKADDKKSKKFAADDSKGEGGEDAAGGEMVRALQYGNSPHSGWWAPSGWHQPMCPCPTDPPTDLPTYHPTYQPTDIPTEVPTEVITEILTIAPTTLSPTVSPTVSPTKVFEGCPWYFWGGEEGLGFAVGAVQETPELQLKDVIDLSAGSRHTFIIEEISGVYVSGFIESLSGYRGHFGVVRDRLSEGPNGFLNVKFVVNDANEIVPSPKFVKVYAGAGAPGDSRGMHSLLIDQKGNVYTTGNNDKGQLCHGDLESRDTFRQVASLPGPAKAAAVGLDFTQILLSDGRVFGCGNNEHGELGLGPNVPYATTPNNMNGLSDIEAVSVGLSFSLYLQADNVFGRNEGKVFGSGSNLYSQLCNSTGGDTVLVPEELNVGTVASIQAGRESSYFLDQNGNIQSCGRNDQGQLGDGTFEDSHTPVKVVIPQNISIRNFASGPSAASVFFAADADVVFAAGQNYQFQLGIGSIGSQNVPVLVEFEESLHEIVKISSSGTHTVAISCPINTEMPTLSPTEYPTINPTKHPTGEPTITPSELPTMSPTQFPTVSPTFITLQPTISPTISPTLVTEEPTQSPTMSPTYITLEPTISPTNSPTDITYAPTLSPTIEPTLSPTLITDEPTYLPTLSPTLSPTRIAFNWYFWGAEEGRGNTLGGNQEVPQQIEAEITDVSAGSRHTFLIEAGGTVQAAGFIESDSGYKGHLGLGPSITRCEGREIWSGVCKEQDVLRPVTTVVDADGNKVDAPPFRHAYAGVGVASDSGAMHALLISEDGKAYLSGNNNKGQLCLGNLDPVDYFHEVKGVDNVVNGAVGEEFTLLVTESGQVYGCGSNEVGQLGEGPELAQSNVPIEIKGEAGDINGITEVATGLGFAIYLNGETGEVWGSGSNIYGQLCAFTEGIPSIYLPQIIFKGVTDEKVIQVEASRESAYFLFEDNVARSCGRNDEGQLGNGDFVNTSEETPIVQVDLNEKIVRLGSGPSSQSVFFIGEDGVWASGLNDRFQLGIGQIGSETKPVPVKFSGPVEIQFVSSSGSHTVANGRYL